jgi:8-oxo-dGTP diphosphatase
LSKAPRAALDVVVAVIRGDDGRILIALRPSHLDQGGLWEFPGGKREPGESRLEALARELGEELGIEVRGGTPLLQLSHAYPDKDVRLDIWEVTDWRGFPTGREAQTVRWIEPGTLENYEFPAANSTIVTAARLPRLLLMPSASFVARAGFIEALEQWLRAGFKAAVLPSCTSATIEACFALADEYDATIHLAELAQAGTLPAGIGRHLSAADLKRAAAGEKLPAPGLSASVGSAADFRLARQIGVDWIVMTGAQGGRARPLRELSTDLQAAVAAAKVPVYKTAAFDFREHTDLLREGFQGAVITDDGLGSTPAALADSFRRTLAAASVTL